MNNKNYEFQFFILFPLSNKLRSPKRITTGLEENHFHHHGFRVLIPPSGLRNAACRRRRAEEEHRLHGVAAGERVVGDRLSCGGVGYSNAGRLLHDADTFRVTDFENQCINDGIYPMNHSNATVADLAHATRFVPQDRSD